MSVKLPNGSLVYIASGYGAAKTMSVLTNASEAVATLEAAHGVVEGDFIEVTSGWSRLTNKIVRAGTISTNDVQLDLYDTTSTTIYAAGAGTGTGTHTHKSTLGLQDCPVVDGAEYSPP